MLLLALLASDLKITDAIKPFKANFMASRFAWRAESLYYAGNYASAAEEFKSLVDEYEFSSLADRRRQVKAGLGWCYLHLDKYQDARDQLGPVTLATGSPKFLVVAYYGIGIAQFNTGDFQGAYRSFASVVTGYPEFDDVVPDVMYYQGLSAFAMEAYGDAVAIWERLLTKYPRSPRAAKTALDVAGIYIQANQPDKAREKLTWFRQNFPNSPDAPKALIIEGDLLLDGDDFKAALEKYDEVVSRYPNSDYVGIAQAKMEQLLIKYGPQITADSAFMRTHPSLAASLAYFPALNAYKDGRYTEALAFLQEFINDYPADPRIPDALGLAAECLIKKERYADALPYLERLLTQYPGRPGTEDLKYLLGIVHLSLEHWRDAFRYFDQYVSENPQGKYGSDADTHMKAIAAAYPEAIEGYTVKNPEIATLSLYSSATKALEDGDTLRAAHLFSQFIDAYPKDPKAKNATLLSCRFYYELGDYLKAFELAKRYLDTYSGDADEPVALYIAGSALLAQKDYNGAMAYYDMLVSKYPQHTTVEDAKKRMQAIIYEAGDQLTYQPKSSDVAAEAMLTKAGKMLNEGNKEGAADLWVEFALKNPNHPKAPKVLIAAAQSFYEAQRFKKALDAITLYKEKYPQGEDMATALYFEANIYIPGGSYIKALDILQEVIVKYPGSDMTARSKERAEAIIASYADSLRARNYTSWKVPDLKSTYEFILAARSIQTGDTLSAASALYEFAKKNPTSSKAPDALYSAGYFYYIKGDAKGAKDAFEHLLGQFPAYENKETALFLLGACLYQLELYDGAISTLTGYTKQYPGGKFSADALKFIGFSYIKKDKPQDAKAYLEAAASAYESQGKKDEAKEIRKIIKGLK
ncbi:MAG: outer membrane protein assembly factor BamD [candidate division WOR-3 bacterium]